MAEKKVVMSCRVPRGLLYEDVLPYVRRKLAGIGGFYQATLRIVYCSPFSTDNSTEYEFFAIVDEEAIPLLRQRDIVLEIEDHVEPAPPPPRPENLEQLFDDEPPGGVTASPGPLIEPLETIWKLAKPLRFAVSLAFIPLVAALGKYERLRSRYYRDWS